MLYLKVVTRCVTSITVINSFFCSGAYQLTLAVSHLFTFSKAEKCKASALRLSRVQV